VGTRTWVKIFAEPWLTGTLREETAELRGLWADLLCLAATGVYGDTGRVALPGGVGLTDEQLAAILGVEPALWQAAKARLVETERIIVTERGCIQICNWAKYQSEYERQKPYRKGQKGDGRVKNGPLADIDEWESDN